MGLSEAEKQELIRSFRVELEEQLQRRQQADTLQAANRERRREADKETDRARLRREVAQKFWEEKGYKLYTDSRGNTMWMTEEAYERRMRRKKRRRSLDSRLLRAEALRRYSVYGGVVVLAVLLGLALASAG